MCYRRQAFPYSGPCLVHASDHRLPGFRTLKIAITSGRQYSSCTQQQGRILQRLSSTLWLNVSCVTNHWMALDTSGMSSQLSPVSATGEPQRHSSVTRASRPSCWLTPHAQASLPLWLLSATCSTGELCQTSPRVAMRRSGRRGYRRQRSGHLWRCTHA